MSEQIKSAVEQLAECEAADAEQRAVLRLAAAKSGAVGYDLALLEPIMVGPTKVDTLHFRPQTLADMRLFETAGADAADRDKAFTASLCGLTKDQLGQLSWPDWVATQEVLAGFALRRAAGGPAR